MMKKGLIILGAVVGILGTVFTLIFAVSSFRLNKTYDVAVQPVSLPSDEAALAEGARLFTTRGCSDCHGPDGSGGIMLDDPAIGLVAATNLTSGVGGVAADYDDATMARAIRNGLNEENKPLLFMPSHEFQKFSDEDTALLIAHIRNLPPVNNELPESSAGLVGRILFVAGQMPLVPAEMVDHEATKVAVVANEATAEFGEYLAQGCTGCHGAGFSGGAIPGAPPDWLAAANITLDEATGIGSWSEADFITAIRTGVRPDGSTIDPMMPWQNFSKMTDVELEALWL
ncbi:MAG: c-type cytochrome, partial [Chloroflexota bacterium]